MRNGGARATDRRATWLLDLDCWTRDELSGRVRVVQVRGHSLGLSQAVQGELQFHNQGDNQFIMDAGQDRTLEERAELNGEGPSTWHPLNRSYLADILPRRP